MKLCLKSICLTLCFILFIVAVSFAWTLKWDAPVGADGYKLYYANVLGVPDEIVEQDIGNVVSHSINGSDFVKGERYEFWLKAYNSAGLSPESDHLKWTFPKDIVIIETVCAPSSLSMEPNDI